MGDVHVFVDEGQGQSAYVVDLGVGSSAVIDPPRFSIELLTAARSIGAIPRWTTGTHSHADYMKGVLVL